MKKEVQNWLDSARYDLETARDMDLWERLWLLGQARAGMRKKPMEILGLTEEEFESEDKGTFIGDEVKSKGIEII